MLIVCGGYVCRIHWHFLSWRKNCTATPASDYFAVCWGCNWCRGWCKNKERCPLAIFFASVPLSSWSCISRCLGTRSLRGKETSLGSLLDSESPNCKLQVSAHEHKSALQNLEPVMLPKQTCASSINWTQFLFKPFALHVHPWSLWRNGASKRLQIHLSASGVEAHWSVLMVPAVKRKFVLQTHCILTS